MPAEVLPRWWTKCVPPEILNCIEGVHRAEHVGPGSSSGAACTAVVPPSPSVLERMFDGKLDLVQ